MTIVKRRIITITITATMATGAWNIARATGVSVSPGDVYIKGEAGKTKTEILRVKNPSADVSLFSVYPDEMEDVVRVIPSSFVLEGGAEREIVVEARLKEEGVATGMLSVRAEAISKEVLGGAAGVKIPVRLESVKASPYLANFLYAVSKGGVWILLFAGLLMFAGIMFWYGIKELKNT